MSNLEDFPEYESARALSPSFLRSQLIENTAITLRQQGYSIETIAERLNITTEAAAKAIKNALRKARRDTKEKANEVVEINLRRLDSLIVNLTNRITAGETSQIDRLLKVMDRQAKYLGLDIAARNAALIPPELSEDDRTSAEQIAMNALHGGIDNFNDIPDLSEDYELEEDVTNEQASTDSK